MIRFDSAATDGRSKRFRGCSLMVSSSVLGPSGVRVLTVTETPGGMVRTSALLFLYTNARWAGDRIEGRKILLRQPERMMSNSGVAVGLKVARASLISGRAEQRGIHPTFQTLPGCAEVATTAGDMASSRKLVETAMTEGTGGHTGVNEGLRPRYARDTMKMSEDDVDGRMNDGSDPK